MTHRYPYKTIAALIAITALLVPSPAVAQNDPQADDDRSQNIRTDQQSEERFEARRVSPDQQTAKPLHQAVADKLRQANEAEIELAKMAQEQIQHEGLRALTQTIIEDHQELNQQLQKISQSGHSQGSQTAMVPGEVCQLMKQACENNLQMTKQMLQNYEGQDFQMAFLGQQIFAHTAMLAELKAIESVGPDSLQSIARAAARTTENHLEQAKQLAKKLEDDQRRGASTQR